MPRRVLYATATPSGKRPSRQRGTVLITAMLLVALVTAITVSLSWRYNLSLARAENRWHGIQARAYLNGAETLAATVLEQDYIADQEEGAMVDTLEEFWAQPPSPFPTDEGWVTGKLEDAQGRFNLNLMAAKKSNVNRNTPRQEAFTPSQKRFIRLLQTFEFEDGFIDESQAMDITEAVIDWVDVDNDVTGYGGAEADYYQQLEPPATPANQLMASVSELSRIKGMTPELYQRLLPYITVLPMDAKMNINTMPPQLIRTLGGENSFLPLNEEEAQLIIEERGALGGVLSPGDFADLPAVVTATQVAGGLNTADLVVNSEFFLVFSETQVGEQVRSATSLLWRNMDRVQVVRRSDAHL